MMNYRHVVAANWKGPAVDEGANRQGCERRRRCAIGQPQDALVPSRHLSMPACL